MIHFLNACDQTWWTDNVIYIYFGLFHFLYLVNTPSLIAAPLVYIFSLLPGKKHPKNVFQDRGIFFCLTCINLTFLQVSKAQRSWNLIGLLLDKKYLFSLFCLPQRSALLCQFSVYITREWAYACLLLYLTVWIHADQRKNSSLSICTAFIFPSFLFFPAVSHF